MTTLNHSQLGISSLKFGFKTSLYYGLCFEGCQLEWTRTHTAAIQITKMEPRKSTKDYPYFGYPDSLPYFPLEIIDKTEIEFSEVEEEFDDTGWDLDPSRVYVLAHSHGDLGLALFHPESCGDILFELDTETGEVRATS